MEGLLRGRVVLVTGGSRGIGAEVALKAAAEGATVAVHYHQSAEGAEKTLGRIEKWREVCPELTIRSTFIIGFPGETEEEFEELLTFLDEAQIDRAGCFRYEPVRGAAANELGSLVPDEVKEQRYVRFMERQQAISAKRLKRKVGTRQQVIIDKVEGGIAIGRTRGDAPEIDGVVHVSARRPLKVGELANVKIERADAYDLFGQAVGF